MTNLDVLKDIQKQLQSKQMIDQKDKEILKEITEAIRFEEARGSK